MVNEVHPLRSREVTALTLHPVLFSFCGNHSGIRPLPHFGPRGSISVLITLALVLSPAQNQIRYAWGGRKTWSKSVGTLALKNT